MVAVTVTVVAEVGAVYATFLFWAAPNDDLICVVKSAGSGVLAVLKVVDVEKVDKADSNTLRVSRSPEETEVESCETEV